MQDSMRTLFEARDHFLSDGEVRGRHARAVRPEVLASWARSRMSGASADTRVMPFEQGNPESQLCVAAEPVLARLAERISGLHAGVLLSDRNARILRRWAPQSSILHAMDQIGSAVGNSGSEALLGTNGIGTVVEERRAQMVVGAEHYAGILTSFTCVGAPILHPLTRRFAGVVTLNSGIDAASPLLIALVASTAHEVEQRLLEQASQRERMLLDAFLASNHSGLSCAVVGEDVYMASPRAARLLEGVDHALIWQQMSDAVAARRLSLLVGDAGRVVAVRCSPLHLDGRPVGALLVVEDPDLRPNVPAPDSSSTRSSTGSLASRTPTGLGRSPWTPGPELLPGRSAAWTTMLEAAAAQAQNHVPLTVFGESGTGKLSLLRSMFGPGGELGDVGQVLDCSAAIEDSGAWLRSVRRAIEAGAPYIVLRHLDTLPKDVAGALAGLLAELTEAGPSARLLATASPLSLWPDGSNHRRLLDLVAVGRLDVPALRERREDIREIISFILRRQATEAQAGLRLSPAALLVLTRAHWPGNVHQLESVLRGLVCSVAGREVAPEMLPHEFDVYTRRRELSVMEQLELDAIMSAITGAQGNKVIAARRLGISRSTLYRKMRAYKLDSDRQFF